MRSSSSPEGAGRVVRGPRSRPAYARGAAESSLRRDPVDSRRSPPVASAGVPCPRPRWTPAVTASTAFARWTFRVAAVIGLIVLVPQYVLEGRIARDDPPAITHPEFYYGFL